MLQEGFLNGNGGRNQILHQMLKSKTCLAIPAKLKLLQLRKFHGHKLFHDKWEKSKDVTELPINRKMIFRFWLTLVKVEKRVTSEEFQGSFPEITERIQFWEEYIDENGKATHNWDKFWEEIKKRTKAKRLGKQLLLA